MPELRGHRGKWCGEGGWIMWHVAAGREVEGRELDAHHPQGTEVLGSAAPEGCEANDGGL